MMPLELSALSRRRFSARREVEGRSCRKSIKKSGCDGPGLANPPPAEKGFRAKWAAGDHSARKLNERPRAQVNPVQPRLGRRGGCRDQ
jgi:hypothetical protein